MIKSLDFSISFDKIQIYGNISDWAPVSNKVPQVMGSLLFMTYMNDLDSGRTNDISRFADKTKI